MQLIVKNIKPIFKERTFQLSESSSLKGRETDKKEIGIISKNQI